MSWTPPFSWAVEIYAAGATVCLVVLVAVWTRILHRRVQDRTAELQRTVDALRRSEAQLQGVHARITSILDASPDLLLEFDEHRRYASSGIVHSPGSRSDRSHLLGHSYHEVLSPEDAQVVDSALDAARRNGHDYGRVICSTLGGTPTWLELSVSYIAAAEAGEGRYVVVARDITARRAAELSSQRAARALRLLTNCNIAMVGASTEAELLQSVCDELCQAGGYRMTWVGYAEHDEARTVRVMARSGDRTGYLDEAVISWSDATPAGRGPSGSAIRARKTRINHRCLDNPEFAPWRHLAVRSGFQSSITLPMAYGDEVLGGLMIYSAEPEAFQPEEVTLLEELAGNLSYCVTTLRDREKRLVAEAAARSRTTFLATMSHEIRTPMNAIIGLSHLALKTALTDQQRGYLEKIQGSGKLLLGILNDVLDLSKIDAGKLSLELQEFDLRAQCALVVEQFRDSALAKAVELELELAPTLPARVIGDSLRISQILLNLVSNAVKFTDSGRVHVSVRPESPVGGQFECRFEVRDTGIGIDPDQQGLLFQSFHQADNSTTRKYGGTGLGLSICKALVELMGGRIGMESQLQAGSLFWFSIRLGVVADAAAPGPESAPRAAAGGGLEAIQGARLLVVEDNELNQELAYELLTDDGFQVDMAANGEIGVAMAAQTDYDLIFMDMQMPVMDGLEATRRIRGLPGRGEVPIVAMTGNALQEDRDRCMAAGMNDFIAKPFDPDHLIAVLARWIRPRTPGAG